MDSTILFKPRNEVLIKRLNSDKWESVMLIGSDTIGKYTIQYLVEEFDAVKVMFKGTIVYDSTRIDI